MKINLKDQTLFSWGAQKVHHQCTTSSRRTTPVSSPLSYNLHQLNNPTYSTMIPISINSSTKIVKEIHNKLVPRRAQYHSGLSNLIYSTTVSNSIHSQYSIPSYNAPPKRKEEKENPEETNSISKNPTKKKIRDPLIRQRIEICIYLNQEA